MIQARSTCKWFVRLTHWQEASHFLDVPDEERSTLAQAFMPITQIFNQQARGKLPPRNNQIDTLNSCLGNPARGCLFVGTYARQKHPPICFSAAGLGGFNVSDDPGPICLFWRSLILTPPKNKKEDVRFHGHSINRQPRTGFRKITPPQCHMGKARSPHVAESESPPA